MRRIIYRKRENKFCASGHQVIGRKEVGKAERFRKIWEKEHEKSMARPDSALRASSSAIKRVIEGRIAHLGRQFGTLCLILSNQNGHRRDCKNGTTSALRMCLTSNQKVSKWIAIHLQQIDRLQIRHFVSHLAIKRWQSRRKIYGLINIMQITPLIL